MLRTNVRTLEMGLGPQPNFLVEWLNENRGHRGYTRLAKLLEAIKELGELKKRVFADIAKNGSADSKVVKPAIELLNRVNKTLRDYKVFPQFFPLTEGFSSAIWMPVKAGAINGWIKGRRRETAQKTVEECNAALTLFGLARNDRLTLLRACFECGEWFYSKRSNQKFHSEECQKKHFRSRPGFKRKRAKYMRDYRELQKNRNVR